MSTRQSRRRSSNALEIDADAADDTLSIVDTAGSSRKRKRSNGDAHVGSSRVEIDVENIDDIEEGDALNTTLNKQRQEQVAMQEGQGDKPAGLKTLSCVICMDTPTDLTATVCGHLFCHECLEQSLRASERQTADARKSHCPVCRKALSRKKKGDVISLLIMKGQPRKSRTDSKDGAQKTK